MSHHRDTDPEAGELRPVAVAVAASIKTAALACRAALPICPRLWALAREVRTRAGLAPRADLAAVRLAPGIVP